MSEILTVSTLSEHIRHCVEGHFPFVWVKGEVSNLSRPSSGHVYFSLKDEYASLPCVWFKRQQREEENFDPLTGEVFEGGPRPSLAQSMCHGQQIMCAGHITTYAQRGVYQLLVELAQDAGQGQLFVAFEAMKARLAARGFFAPERKRPLPSHPQRVAVITSPTGAVIHDFLRIAQERGLPAQIRIYPVPVQGTEAAPAIARAFAQITAENWAEVIVLIRGGGSLEDLWAFNEEVVAEAVYTSSIPVLAGIGHEVDVCMADMTADVRASTPSHAAQLLWMPRQNLQQRVDDMERAVQSAQQRIWEKKQSTLQGHAKALGWLSPWQVLTRHTNQCAHLTHGLQRSMHERVTAAVQKIQTLHDRCLRSITPLIDSKNSLRQQQERALMQQMHNILHQRSAQGEKLHIQLEGYNPYAPLARGYALVQGPHGQYVRSVQQVNLGDTLKVLLHDGNMETQVKLIDSESKS